MTTSLTGGEETASLLAATRLSVSTAGPTSLSPSSFPTGRRLERAEGERLGRRGKTSRRLFCLKLASLTLGRRRRAEAASKRVYLSPPRRQAIARGLFCLW